MSSHSAARLVCPELVGRDVELATIAERMAAVASGAASTILISGEAGLGKSTLLARAVETSRSAGLRSLRADCVRLEIRRAFGPFVDALRDIQEPGPAARAALTVAPPPGTGQSGIASDDRYFAHAAFARAFAELVDERPLLLAIDDLHWADDASLELFAYLSRRLAHGILLIGTFRPDELRSRPVARHAVADVHRDRLWDLSLRPLTPSETARALRLTFGSGARIKAEHRELLHARCSGNPLFLQETLRALAHRGDLAHRGGAWQLSAAIHDVPLPHSVQDAVRERFDALDEETRTILIAAAVIGERFAVGLLSRVSGAQEHSVWNAIRIGIREHFIEEDEGYPQDRCRFRHPLIRDAVAGESLQHDRRALHERIARAIECSESDGDALALLAYHWDEAGDRGRAFDYHRRAAEEDRARMAYAEALRHFERARELAPEDDRIIADLLMRIAEMCGVVGPVLRVVECVEAAMARYERLGDARAVGYSLLKARAVGIRTTWSDERSFETAQRAYEVLAPLGDSPELTWALTAHGLELALRGDMSTGIKQVEDAVAMGERCNSTWELANAYQRLGLLRWWSGDVEGGLAALRSAVERADGVPGSGLRMDVHTLRTLHDILHRTLGPSAETQDVAERLRVLAERYGAGIGESRSDDTIVSRLHQLFHAPAWDEFIQLHDDYAAENEVMTFYAAHLLTHRLYIEVARAGVAALHELPLALPAMFARGSAIEPFVHIVQLHILAGDYRSARDVLESVAPAAATPRIGQPLAGDPVMYGLVLAAATGDEDYAMRWLERVDWEPLRFPFTTFPSRVQAQRYARAERGLRAGDPDGAIAAIGTLVRERMTAPKTGELDPVLTRFISLRLVGLLVERGNDGDRDLAAVELGRVVDFYRRAGATWYLSRLREQADAWGVLFPAEASPAIAPSLTRRESEIASLVAKGLTNRQIAEKLGVSVRTAESHVDQIRGKLGFRTRSQIATWVGQRSRVN